MKTFKLELTEDDLNLVLSALDSHKYWQLSDEKYRNDGYVMDPGSDDAENAEEIQECDVLVEKIVFCSIPVVA